MDSLEFLTLRDVSRKIFRSYNALRNEVRPAAGDPSRGYLSFHNHAQPLPLFRLGRQWLVKKEDLEALFSNPADDLAPAAAAEPTPARRTPGRPRSGQDVLGFIGGIQK